MDYFTVLSHHLAEGTEENQEHFNEDSQPLG
jgi:hypothetical protein